MVGRSLVVEKKEGSISDDGAADDAAKLVVRGHGLGYGKEAAGRQRADAVELIAASVDLVRPGLQNDIGYRSARAPQLRVVVAGSYVDRLKRLNRRDVHGVQTGALLIVDPLDHGVVGQPGLPIHLRGEAVLRVEERRMWPECARGAGYQVQQALKIAVGRGAGPRLTGFRA